MSELELRRHGLEPFLESLDKDVSVGAGISIQIQPRLGHINLRGNLQNAAFVKAVTKLLEQDLPVPANTMTIAAHRIYWLGPDEWLILTPVDGTPELIARLQEALLQQHASVTELGGGQMAFHLSGANARSVLAKGCTLDLRPGEFKTGDCAQSGLAKANVLIGLIDDNPIFEIVVRRSFMEYLALWLQHAATEHGAGFSAIE